MVCVVGRMRDLILQLSKSSIYSTKPRLEANPSKASFQRLYKVLNILGVEMSLNSAPILTDARTSKFVEKEFDLPARSEDW
ncbi:XRE family transcriptional regulator [Klebsiella pneumoniae]|uniref:XRE family transcriptional regulator n=1 Tax=Klebsiella pneumoniae TaxID=573 RepID=UPI003AAB1C9A